MYQTLDDYTTTKESKLVTLGFVSEATEEFGLMGVMRLFFQSCTNNRDAGITGLLYYDGKHFAQIIEGFDHEVNTLWDVIRKDGRHRKIHVFGKNIITNRAFPTWSMRIKEGGVIAMMCPELKDLIGDMDVSAYAPETARSKFISARLIQSVLGNDDGMLTLH
jgi:hypothetical protein